MHLVIPAPLCLFLVVCHPSRTFPPKELERELQNRLPPSPHRQTTPSLTSDPWPTSLVLVGYKLVVHGSCACSTPIWVICLFSVHAFAITCGFVWYCCVFYCLFNLLWHGWVIGSSFFASHFFFGLGIAWMWAFASFNSVPISFHPWFMGWLVLLPYHCIVPAIISFNLNLLGLFWACHVLFIPSIYVTQYFC